MIKKIIISLLFSTLAQADIISIKKIEDVQLRVESFLKNHKPEKVLVVMDVDNTLLQPNHPALQPLNMEKHQKIYQEMLSQLTSSQQDYVMPLITLKVPQKYVEKTTLKTFRSLEKLGVAMLGLTTSPSGESKDSRNKYIFKLRDFLQTKGFDFKTFKGRVVPYFDSWNGSKFSRYLKGYPLLYHGILSTNGKHNPGANKGEILSVFLNQVGIIKNIKPSAYFKERADQRLYGFFPQVIVMIDSQKKDIEKVEKTLKENFPTVQFLGIEYQNSIDSVPQDISAEDFKKFWEDAVRIAKKY